MADREWDVDSLFLAALEIETGEARAAFLRASCGANRNLHELVDQRLRDHRQRGSFHGSSVPDMGATIASQSLSRDETESQHTGSPKLSEDPDVVPCHAGLSVLQNFGQTMDVPRVMLRETSERNESIMQPKSPEMPDRHADGRYRLDGEIARGGMGAVLKGRDTDLGRELAIKVLLDVHKDKPEVVQRFIEEAQIGGQLQHPGIAPVYELGQFADRRPFFSMKLVKGETLSKLLTDRESPARDRGRFIGIFEQICQTMAYAHSRGVIHRDLKPANIMVGAFGEVQVMDWGLAKVLPAGGIADEKKAQLKQPALSVIRTLRTSGSDAPSSFGSFGSQTQTGSVMGTPAYMPPEQALGEIDNLDERADVFGLGAILCEIVTGKPPYVADDVLQVFRLASRGKLEDCFTRLTACGADSELIELTKHCLELEPSNRPRNASVVAEYISEHLASVESRLRTTEIERAAEAARAQEALHTVAETEAKVRAERRARKWQAALGLSFTGLVVLCGAFAWWEQDQRRTRQTQAEREVQQSIANAEARYAQAQGADRDLGLWAEARAAAMQAQERSVHAAPEIQNRANQLLAVIEQVQKNRSLVAKLLDIQASMGDVVNSEGVQDFPGTDARYEKAFREYGTDLNRLSPAEGAELLRNLGGRLNVELAAALDDWAYVRWHAHKFQLSQAERLFQITMLLDPDQLRNQVRAAIQHQDYQALKRLADEINPASQPSQTANLISVWLLHFGWGPGKDGSRDSIRFLRKAHPHHSGDFQINHNLAWILLYDGNAAEALPYSVGAIAVRPTSSAAWSDYARALESLYRWTDAVSAYRRVAELTPQGWPFLLRAGQILEYQGQPADALVEYRQAALIAGKSSLNDERLLTLGASKWLQHGLIDDLTATVRETIRSDPTNVAAHEALGNLLSNLGKTTDARAEFEAVCMLRKKLVEQFPDEPTYRRELRNSLVALGRTAEAIPHLVAAWERSPHDTLLLLEIVALQSWFGQGQAVHATCQKAISLAKDSADPTTAERTAKVCCLRGGADAAQIEAALALAEKSVRLGGDHPSMGFFQMARGMAQYRAGQYADASETLKPLAETSPTDSFLSLTSAFYRAMALYRCGQEAQAQELASQAVTNMKPLPADEQNPLTGNANHDDLILWLSYKEAASFIELARSK